MQSIQSLIKSLTVIARIINAHQESAGKLLKFPCALFLFLYRISCIQLIIFSFCFNQLIMRSTLNDSSLL